MNFLGGQSWSIKVGQGETVLADYNKIKKGLGEKVVGVNGVKLCWVLTRQLIGKPSENCEG